MENEFTLERTSTDGLYSERRSVFDGFIGTLDGLGDVVGGIGNIVEAGTDIRADIIQSNALFDDQRLETEEAELELLLRKTTVDRGDNVQLYYAIAAAGVAAIFLLRK